MSNDLRKAINDSRLAVKGIPSRTLLGKAVYRALDSAEAAFKCGDAKAVQEELDSINRLLAQN